MNVIEKIKDAGMDLICVSDIEGHVPAYPHLDYEGKRYSFASELTKAQQKQVIDILKEPDEVEAKMFENLSPSERDEMLKAMLIEAGKLDEQGKVIVGEKK